MKILQVAPPWFAVPPTGYGGIEQVVASLADGLAAAGHDVTLLASGGSITSATLRTVFDVPPSESLGDPVVELIHLLEIHLERGAYDVIHDHTLLGAALGAARGSIPVVHTLHGPWTELTRRVYSKLARGVSLVAISRDQAGHAPEIPIAAVVPNGIEMDRFPLASSKGGHLAFVGRANREKGPEVAVEVARRTGLPLVMAIKVNEPAEHEYFDRFVLPRLDGVAVEVHTGATQAETAAIMGSARALVAPLAWDEPFGLVLAEAGACGTPVVAYARGAATEIISDGETGFLVTPGDLDGLCDAVKRVDQIDPVACRRRVDSMYSAARMVEGYQAVYEQVTAPDDYMVLPEPRLDPIPHRALSQVN